MSAPPPEIAAMRQAIDEVDHALLELVARRRALVGEVFARKRALGVPLVDAAREAELVRERRAFAEGLGVPGELAERLLHVLLDDSHARV
jgi:chorismate mutase/prephenate dehydrogenase